MSLVETWHAEHLARKRRLWGGIKRPAPQPEPEPAPEQPLCLRLSYWNWTIRDDAWAWTQRHMARMAIDEIIKIVAEFYQIKPAGLTGPSRMEKFILPRHVAMFIACDTGYWGLSFVARIFHRDHTVLIHARRKIPKLMQADAEFRDEVNYLRNCFWRITDVAACHESSGVS